MKNLLYYILAGTVLNACSGKVESPVIIENFDDNSYGDWQIEGTAFNNGPVAETMGYYGQAHATSENPGSEPATGTLTSPPFEIRRNSIHFLVGARETGFITGTMQNPDDLSVQLLVDEKVVLTHIPDEFHAMFHRGWDVTGFKGKKAQFRIVDKDDREYSYIDADHIVQNNIPVAGRVTERTFQVTHPELNIPVKTGAERHYFELFADGKQVRGFDAEMATGQPDYWVVLDVSRWSGQEVTLRTRQYFDIKPGLLDRITLADGIVGSEDIYNEKLRPQFHFSAKRGWINDPNGLVYYDGEYHLFYQANPFGWDHSRNDYNKTWGHAVSTDLAHWKELPAAIHPDHLGSIYSGSAVVDHNNTTGFQSGEEKPVVAVYTSAGTRNRWSLGKKFTQSLAYSNDRGRTFISFEGNPVKDNLGYINRDPKAFWYEPGQHWVIILYLDHGAFVFFTSQDLKTWERQSVLEIEDFGVEEIAAFEDCPELFELPVDGDMSGKKWVLYAGSGDYVLGDFNGKQFTPESGLIRYNYGDCFYASQTFNNVPEEDGRRIQMAWGTVDFPGMPFNQMLTFPVELSLRNTDDGIRMFAYPVKEIEKLYTTMHERKEIKLEPGENILAGIDHAFLDIQFEFNAEGESDVGFVINGREINYSVNERVLASGEEEAELKPAGGVVRLRILVDRLSVEVFGNDGRIYMPLQTEAEHPGKPIEIYSRGGITQVSSLIVHELESIW